MIGLFVLFFSAAPASAGEADVEGVKVRVTAKDAYAFDVTVRHADEGWQHYADRWEVLAPDGAALGTRKLTTRSERLSEVVLFWSAFRCPGGPGLSGLR